MAETGFGTAPPPTPAVRSWRTAFLTLRDETLTTAPPSSSVLLLRDLILSHSHSLLSAAPELPSHETLSDLLFTMELVGASATSSDQLQKEDLTLIYTQTSRFIHDICRRVSFDINPSSSFTNVLNCFRNILDLFFRNASTATIVPAVECLQALRCIIASSSHRRLWLQSQDTSLVKFLLDVIVNSNPSELQTIAFGMLSEAISRSGSSFSVDIWRSMIQVVRKTMDVLALKSSAMVVEDNNNSVTMSRFYESFFSCLHLILTDPKCTVSDHVSVFVAVLRMFLTYGLSGGTTPPPSTFIGPEKIMEQQVVNKSNRSGAYRPPHLRNRDCSNVKNSRTWDESSSSSVNVTSSDSDFSDGEGSAKESGRVQNSRVRVAALICIQDLCQADSKSFSMQWSLLLPTSDVLQPRKRDATLMTCLLFDPCLKARTASASTLVAMLDGLSSIFLQVAEYKESSKFGSFTALSSSLGQILVELHRGILHLMQHEAHGKLLALLFKILRLVVLSTPYSRMPPNLLATVLTSLRRRIEEGFRIKTDQTNLLAAALSCLTSALSASPSSAQVRKMLHEEVSSAYIETEKKSGVLSVLFEYSMQWSSPTICLEALQALKSVCHNYPNVVTACWERISANVRSFLSIGCPEVSLNQLGEHASTVNEKVLTAIIKVLDECLRAVSGFQGTEDLSDDKLVDIPFASDCIRVKKVSSAPILFDLECKDDDVVNCEAGECGIQQWCEAIEKHMPLILCHSSSTVRAASVTCFAGMTSSVFISLAKEKQDFILSSLTNAAVHDVPSVRSAACRAIGIVSCFPQVCQSAEVLERFIHAVEINTRHSLISVRITASWALANICDAIRHSVRTLPLGDIGSNSNPLLIVSLSECALHLAEDGDKVKSNAVRALGYISRIFRCSTSRFGEFSSNRCQSGYPEDLYRLERIVQAFVSCVKTGNVKVQWNVCHAIGNLFLNETFRLQDMDWAPNVFGILLQLLRESSNYKIRIQAAAALAVPVSVQDYGPAFSDIVQCVVYVMENIGQDQISAPSNFKYMVSLQKQLTLTMLHVLSFTLNTNDDPLKDFLVLKALILEDWFKGLCSSIKGELDVQDKSVVDRKRVMIFSAIQSLIEVYKEKQQDEITQKFEEMRNSISCGLNR